MTLLAAGADQHAVDRHRLEVGLIAYCPVCRRPASAGPTDPGVAFHRLVDHLVADHDPYFLAMLRVRLEATARPDPFYPSGSSW